MNYRILNIQIILLLALAFPAIADENQSQQQTESEKSSSSSVAAADAQQKSDQEKSPGLTLAGVKDYLGLSVYLQGGYVYTVANTSNSFVLDMAELQLWHKPQIGEVGYKLKIMAGSTAEFIHSNGLGASTKDVPFDLTEAYVTYVAPLGSGLTIQFGKFVTFTGAEVLEAKDNMNYSYSFLFLDAIPFTHTGLMLSYTVAEIVTISAYALNGWDNTLDNNRAKTYGLSLDIAPSQYFLGPG